MHLQTSSTATSCLRKKLLDMRSCLLRLYQVLILAEQVTYERIHGRVASPSELLRLVVNDSWFTWLHPFSLLVQRIDQLLDGESELSLVEVKQWSSHIRTFIRISEEGDGFARNYYEALVREPDVVCAHMEVIAQATLISDHHPAAQHQTESNPHRLLDCNPQEQHDVATRVFPRGNPSRIKTSDRLADPHLDTH
jgi:hypothetical protein